MYKHIALLGFLCLFVKETIAQKVFIDQPLRIGEVLLFPSVDDPNVYYYQPGNPRVAIGKDRKPIFSLLMFTKKNRSKVTEADQEEQTVGGIVHTLVEYGLKEQQVAQLRQQLKESNPEARLAGPIIYKSGNIALISAVANSDQAEKQRKIIGIGKAPIIEGQKAAIAFMLDGEAAKLLWATFQTSTPDISFSLEMEMAGYLSPIKGWLKGSYDEVYQAHETDFKGEGTYGSVTFGSEIAATFDKLRKAGKIESYVEGDQADMQQLLTYGYNKLADMMFEPVGKSYSQMINNNPTQEHANGEEPSDLEKFMMLQKAMNGEEGQEEEASQESQAAPFSVYATYRYRRTKLDGNFEINLNKVSSATRYLRFDNNVGNLRTQCKSCFKVVSLDEMYEFKQREILVIIDGSALSDFKKYINSASITLRKKHPNGKYEYDAARVDYANFKENNGHVKKLVYGWKNDPFESWMEYDYKVDWNFFGNYEMKGEWKSYDGNVIALSPPLVLKTIVIDANPKDIADKNIKNILIRLDHKLETGHEAGYYLKSSGEYQGTRPIRLSEELLGEEVQIVAPSEAGKVFYSYKIIHHDNKEYKSKKLLLDEFWTILLPQQQTE